ASPGRLAYAPRRFGKRSAMAVATHSVRPTGFAATERRDAWWVAPLVQGLLLATLICYANWAAIQGNNYYVPHARGGGYLSPFYFTFVYLFFLWRDVFEGARFGSGLGIGVGTLVLLINTAALTFYSFSCHSARHLVGGTLDCFSCSAATRARHSVWRGASALNEHHLTFAWVSLVAVCAAHLYVR